MRIARSPYRDASMPGTKPLVLISCGVCILLGTLSWTAPALGAPLFPRGEEEAGTHLLETNVTAGPETPPARAPLPPGEGEWRDAAAAGLQVGRSDGVQQGLHLIAAAEEAFRAARSIDQDGDGRGDYGFLDELARSGRLQLDPTAGFQDGGKAGIYLRDGYCYRVFLADSAGGGGGGWTDAPSGTGPRARWSCYAWPAYFGVTGTHALCLRSDGRLDVTANALRRYSGVDDGPAPGAALAPSSIGTDHGEPARPMLASDGQLWIPAADLPQSETTIELRDAMGNAIDGLAVAVVDPDNLHRHPWYHAGDQHLLAARGQAMAPCGTAVTDAQGVVRLSGWPVAGMAVAVLGASRRPIDAAGSSVHPREGGLVIRLSAAESRRARVEVGEREALAALEQLGASGRLPGAAGGTTGVIAHGGYLFEFHRGVEPSAAARDAALSTAARNWLCYAWPQEHGSTGLRAFLVTPAGDIVASANQRSRYSGASSRPDPSAAFARDPTGRLFEAHRLGGPGSDGEIWRRAR